VTHDLSSAISDEAPLLQVSDLRVFYPAAQRVWGSKNPYLKVVDGVSLDIHQAETRALVGESGCGKSTFGRGLLGLLRPFDGSVRLEGNDITHMKNADRLKAGLVIQVVFQDPYSSMNPRMLIQDIVAEGLLAKGSITGSELHDRVELLLSSVGLSPEMRFRYPHEFSGGQRQRISIARALALDPKLIVCDEPTSSLDVSVQAKVLELLKQLQLEKGISYLFITHDLAVVSQMADTVSVMKEGRIIECGSVEEVLFSPQETYTRNLIRSLPSLHNIKF
jgi:ABC-type microcin C transport system duplicated ATPase subunit YejF